MQSLDGIVGVPVEDVPIVSRNTAAIWSSTRDACSAAPRMRELSRNTVRRPDRHLGLQRMVLGTIRIVAIVHRAELRVRRYEVFREQPTRAQRAAGDDLTRRLH